MDVKKGLSYVLIGLGTVMLYQSMNGQTKRKIGKAINNAMDKKNDMLKNMM